MPSQEQDSIREPNLSTSSTCKSRQMNHICLDMLKNESILICFKVK